MKYCGLYTRVNKYVVPMSPKNHYVHNSVPIFFNIIFFMSMGWS